MSEHGVTQKVTTAVGARGVSPSNISELWQFANAAHQAGLCKSPQEGFMQIQYAMEASVPVTTALANTYVVQGKLSMFGPLPSMLARRSGLMEWAQERWIYKGEELPSLPLSVLAGNPSAWTDDIAAVYRAKRRDESEPAVRVYSVGMAKRAGLWGKSGNWTLRPDSMLMARARQHVLTYHFPDALFGGYVLEPDEDPKERQAEYEVRPSKRADDLLPDDAEVSAAVDVAELAWNKPPSDDDEHEPLSPEENAELDRKIAEEEDDQS